MINNNEYISKLKSEHGDSFYVLNTDKFEKNYIELNNSFASIYKNFRIAYSYKTNYIPDLCFRVNTLGGYAEVVSEMELELALKVGVDYKDIIWNGPIKSKDVLKSFLCSGGTVNIDSLIELEDILKIQIDLNRKINIGLRCNFDVGDGVISRFGFDIDNPDFYSALEQIRKNENIVFMIMHCHFAKRNIEFWQKRVDGMLELIDKIGIVPKKIDLGGGLFGKMNDVLKKQFDGIIPSYDDYASLVARSFLNKFGFDGPELIIEPGTALVADCLDFYCTVKSIKQVRDKYFATVSGSQKNINMGKIIPQVETIQFNSNVKQYNCVDIVGYTCIEGDVLYENFSGNISVGDMIVFKNCGSYSIVMKPPFILPNYPVIEIKDNSLKVIKKAESFNDIFRTYNFLNIEE